MKKKVLTALVTPICTLCCVLGLAACGGDASTHTPAPTPTPSPSVPPTDDDALQRFVGITLDSKEFTYDGQPHSLEVSGAVPQGAEIEYAGNGKTDAGTYTVSATLSKTGYETKTLTATLTVKKATFVGITLESKKFVYFGKVYSLAVTGTVPENTVITYENNDQTEVGKYDVTATLTNPNYETLTLHADLTITAKTEIAKSIVDRLLNKPEPWSFLPTALTPEEMAYDRTPIGGLESFATSVAVTQIKKKSIGKQFNVLYDGLIDAASAIDKIDGVFAIGSTIAEAYQTFINNNPDGYATFVKEIGGFKIKIVLDGDKSLLLAGNSAVSIELAYDSESGERTGRVQITDGVAIKYTASENSLKLAVKATVSGVGNLKQIEFVRSGGAVGGYLREFTGTDTKNLKTSGVIASNADITAIMSDKRESEDLAINGYEEIYSSATGEYLGGRVKETIKVVDYDTLWLHMSDVTGFDSVRVADEENGLNIDSVFVNGQNKVFATKKVNPIIPTSSRRFDVEMKDVWYVVAETVDGKTEYKKIKTSIPMLFVQTEQTDAFPTDVTEKNSYMSDVALPTDKIDTVNTNYAAMEQTFVAVKTEVAYEDIQNYIGNKNEFFEVG